MYVSTGENLSTCVFQLVQHSQGLIGEYRPKCTLEGEYESIQCQGSECWCVDAIGDVISGTIKNRPDIPKCPSGKYDINVKWTFLNIFQVSSIKIF